MEICIRDKSLLQVCYLKLVNRVFVLLFWGEDHPWRKCKSFYVETTFLIYNYSLQILTQHCLPPFQMCT